MAASDYLSFGRWMRTALMTTLGLLAIYAEAAPLGLGPDARPSPDFLVGVIFFWAARRPGSTPMIAVFALGLTRDLLTDVPVGAGTLSLVLIAEMVKAGRRHLVRTNFAVEWLALSGAALAMVIMQWCVVLLTLAQPPYLIDLGYQVLYTAAVYPIVVFILGWIFQISWRKGEVAA